MYKPILQKCYVVLNKLARSHITHDNAISIVARKIVPAICYPCSVVRPTKAQMDNLRSKIFEATAFRKCQTQAAHSVFCERTHHFDPDSAMVYHNMRFWRQVFVQAPWLARQLKDLLNQSIPPKQDFLGPLTLFQKDIAWLDCRFIPDSDALCNEDNDCILFTEPDKRKFEHFIREQIRKHFYKYLEQKHSKWQGVAMLICMPQRSCCVDLSHHHLFVTPLSDCFLTHTLLHTDFVTCELKQLYIANTALMMTAPFSMFSGIVRALLSYAKIGLWSSAIALTGPLVQKMR